MKFLLDSEVNQKGSLPPSYFVDGRCKAFRKEIDIELSHWVPNSTPVEFLADTSTQICLNFVESSTLEFEYVINNHLDTDGLCSVFTLLNPKLALLNKEILSQLSKMGDFGFFGDKQSALLYSHLAQFLSAQQKSGKSTSQLYSIMLEFLKYQLESREFCCSKLAIDEYEKLLEHEKALKSEILIHTLHERLVVYEFMRWRKPWNFEFDQGLQVDCLLPPQIRNLWHAQSTIILALPTDLGFQYLFLMPQYIWAQTPNLYFPSYLKQSEKTNNRIICSNFFDSFLQRLNRCEENQVDWLICSEVSPFSSFHELNFPFFGGSFRDCLISPSSIDIESFIEICSATLAF